MISSKDKVRNYAYYTGKPFTMKQIIADLGISKTRACVAIQELVKLGVIRKLGSLGKEKHYKLITMSKEEQEARALLRKHETKTFNEIAKEMGVSKQAVHEKVRDYLPPKELRATRNQYDALKLISDGWQPNGYRETVKSLLKRGWVVEVSAFTYKITATGQEVLNAKS